MLVVGEPDGGERSRPDAAAHRVTTETRGSRHAGHYRCRGDVFGGPGRRAAPDDIDDLARRARDGDRDALESLLAAVRPRVLNICRGVLPYSGDAEDACQEAMLNVATKIGVVGRSRPVHHLAARRRGQQRALDLPPAEEPRHARPTSRTAAHDRPDPRTTSVIAGTRLDLLEAMETIEKDHPQFVEPLLLRDVYGLPYDEIATLVDAPLGTVKAQIHHGRKLARPLLRGER